MKSTGDALNVKTWFAITAATKVAVSGAPLHRRIQEIYVQNLKDQRRGILDIIFDDFMRKSNMATPIVSHGPADYQIIVKGELGDQWSDWFAGMTIATDGDATILTASQIDQSALHGLLVRIRDLGLPLISVERMQGFQNSSSIVTCGKATME